MSTIKLIASILRTTDQSLCVINQNNKHTKSFFGPLQRSTENPSITDKQRPTIRDFVSISDISWPQLTDNKNRTTMDGQKMN